MKLAIPNNLNPKHIFRSKSHKTTRSRLRNVSRSDPQSLSSGSATSTSSDGSSTAATPTTVLRATKSLQILPSDVSDFELAQAFNLISNCHSSAVTVSAADVELLLARAVSSAHLDDDDEDDEKDLVLCDSSFESSSSPDDDLREAFNIFDADKDGKISAEELLKVFTWIGDERCTLEDCRRMISGVDSDGDGFVCFRDFSKMMMVDDQEQR